MINNTHQHHQELIDEAVKQLEAIFVNSQQAIYVYLDDLHKACNQKFASLLGYKSPDEWSKVSESFPQAFVADKSQRVLVSAYQQAMDKMVASTVGITWKTKDGKAVPASVILTPISYNGHLFALHFISKTQ